MIKIGIISENEGYPVDGSFDIIIMANGKRMAEIYYAMPEFSHLENERINKYELANLIHELGNVNEIDS